MLFESSHTNDLRSSKAFIWVMLTYSRQFLNEENQHLLFLTPHPLPSLPIVSLLGGHSTFAFGWRVRKQNNHNSCTCHDAWLRRRGRFPVVIHKFLVIPSAPLVVTQYDSLVVVLTLLNRCQKTCIFGKGCSWEDLFSTFIIYIYNWLWFQTS